MAIGAAGVVSLVVLAVILAHLYVDWLWFGEVGLRTVFWKRLEIGAVTAIGFGAAFFFVVYGNLVIARRLAPKYRPVEGVDVIEAVHESALRWVGRLGLVAALLGALIAARSAAGSWLVFARALNGVPSASATRSSITTCRSTCSGCRRGSTPTGSSSPR